MVKLIFKTYKRTDNTFCYNFFSIYKNVNRILSQSKERLSKKACEQHQNLSEEQKDKRRQYASEWYRNLSEEEQEKKCQYGHEWYKKLLEHKYRKNISRMPEIKTSWV